MRQADRGGRDGAGARIDFGAEVAHAVAEHGGALGCLAFPEGNAWRSAVSVLDEDLALGIDALNAPAGVAEKDDVAW